jgi:hypothetical protein
MWSVKPSKWLKYTGFGKGRVFVEGKKSRRDLAADFFALK